LLEFGAGFVDILDAERQMTEGIALMLAIFSGETRGGRGAR